MNLLHLCDFASIHGCVFDGRYNIWRTFRFASVQNRGRDVDLGALSSFLLLRRA